MFVTRLYVTSQTDSLRERLLRFFANFFVIIFRRSVRATRKSRSSGSASASGIDESGIAIHSCKMSSYSESTSKPKSKLKSTFKTQTWLETIH